MIPRLRARIGQAEEPEEMKGKYFVEVSMWDLAGEKLAGPPWNFGPFETEEIAKEAMMGITRQISETIEEEMTGKKSGRYMDLKNGGVMRPWEEH